MKRKINKVYIKRARKTKYTFFLNSKVSRDMNNKLIDTIDEAYFPPVVNYNPVDNAHDLSIEDAKEAYNALYASFNVIKKKKNKPIHPLLEECLLGSYSQFMFFAIMFKELEKILPQSDLGFSSELEIPYNRRPKKLKTQKENTFFIQPPLYLEKVRDKYRIQYKSYGDKNYKNISPVMLHRYNYISRNYEITDFKEGFPAWYTLQQNILVNLFERYVPQLNKRIRIRWNKNEFEYHICGASDNWQKIYDVPLEMDNIIAALLFRK